MAGFNPTVEEQTPNFLGYSRGTVPDTSIAGVVENSSNILEADIKAGIKYYDTKIAQEARERTQPIQDAYIGILSSHQGMEADQRPVPTELTRRLDRTTSMQDAVRSGSMRESHYRNLLDAEARAMRANYPGFQDVVDQHIARLVGGNPANQTIQELFQEARAGKSGADKDAEYWLHQANKEGVIPDLEARRRSGNPISIDEMRERVTLKTAQNANISVQKQKLELAKAQGENIKEQTKTTFGKEVQTRLSLMYKTALGPYENLKKQLDEAQRGAGRFGDLDPQQQQAIIQTFNKLEQGVDDMINNIATNPTEKGFRYTDVLKEKSDIQGIADAAKAPIQAIKTAIFDKDFGTIGSIANRLEQLEKNDQIGAMSVNDSLRQINLIKNVAGQQWTALQAFQNAETLKGMTRLSTEDNILRSLSGKQDPNNPNAPPPSINQDFKQKRSERTQDPALYRATLNKNVEFLGNPSIDPTTLANVATYMYGDANKDFLATRDKEGNLVNNFSDSYGVYLKMAGDPKVAQNMLKLRESNPTVYNNYKSWVQDNFGTMLRMAANSASEVNADNLAGKVEWDPESLTFKMQSYTSTSENITQYNKAEVDRKAGKSVQDINKVLLGMSTLIKAEGGNPQEVLPSMVLKLGITPPNDNPKSLWQKMFGTSKQSDIPVKPGYVELIKGFEGFSPDAKPDFKQYSVGYGRKAQPGEKAGTPIQEEQKLIEHAKPVVDWIDNNISIPLSPRQRDALVSFGYNLGTSQLERLKEDINAGKFGTVAMRMSTFNRSGGKEQAGLTSRRAREAMAFQNDPFMEGTTATGPDGQKIEYRGGRWVPLQ